MSVTSVDPSLSAVNTLQQNFAIFDIAANGGEADSKVSRNDVETVAANSDGQYSAEQQQAAQYILDHPYLFDLLDTSADDDGNTDDIITQQDVSTAQTALADPYGTATATLENEFATFDAAGDGGDTGQVGYEDGEVSFHDLVIIATSDDGTFTPQQIAAARYFLDHVELFHQADIAREGTDPDGLISLDDAQAMADRPAPANAGASPMPASADLDGNGELSLEEQQLAAENLAPILYVDPDDGYLLTDPEQYIAGSTVTTLHGTPVEDPVAYLQQNPGATLIIDPSDASNPQPDAARTYYHYDPDTNSITYFYFYPNNDGPQGGAGVGDIQNHEGDWERVTVQLDGNFQPQTVYYSAHKGSDSMAWRDVVKENGRPVVFVAQGSHANFFHPGSNYGTGFPGAEDRTVSGPADGLRIDTQGVTLTNIEQPKPWWYSPQVLWGEQREASLTVFPGICIPTPFGCTTVGEVEISSDEFNDAISGPHGPHPDKNTLVP